MIDIFGSMDGSGDSSQGDRTLITEVFSRDLLKTLFYHALRVDIEDNNEKAEILRGILDPREFDELGTGTNRIAYLHDGLVYKIALDRRGLVDNFTEFKRSIELPEYLAKTYETNMLINVSEYIYLIDQDTFTAQDNIVRATLADLSKAYLFEDLGFSLKNSANWGYRDSGINGKTLVILDYGYLYPLAGQDTERLFRCPKCGGKLEWNGNFTSFECSSKSCRVKLRPTEIRNRMNLDIENFENQFISSLSAIDAPDFTNIEKYLMHID